MAIGRSRWSSRAAAVSVGWAMVAKPSGSSHQVYRYATGDSSWRRSGFLRLLRRRATSTKRARTWKNLRHVASTPGRVDYRRWRLRDPFNSRGGTPLVVGQVAGFGGLFVASCAGPATTPALRTPFPARSGPLCALERAAANDVDRACA
jgi:hypothetical protein